MKKKPGFLLVFIALFVLAGACGKNEKNIVFTLYSPDSLIQVKCQVMDSLDGVLQYSVDYRNKALILPSAIEVDPAGAPAIKNHFRVVNSSTLTINEPWNRVWGKRREVMNRYRELKVELQETAKPRRKFNVYFRAYDDGVGIRYEIPVQQGLDSIVLSNEKIAFRFKDDHTVWAAFWNTFHISQEKEFLKSKISDIKEPGNIIGTPLLVKAGDSAWVSLLEANVTDWNCSGLTVDRNLPNTLVSRPSWLPHDTTIVLRTKNQRLSPWKVIMIADHPGKLVESDIVQNLNEPCAIKDVSSIKPGISAWDWWWSGRYAPKAGFRSDRIRRQ